MRREKEVIFMRNELAGVLSDVKDGTVPVCAQDEGYQEATNKLRDIRLKLGEAIPTNCRSLLSELESAFSHVNSIEAYYGDEAVFLYGVDTGLMLAKRGVYHE